MRPKRFGEHDFGVGVACFEPKHSLVEHLPQHSGAGPAPTCDDVEPVADLTNGDVALAEPLLERPRDEPRAGNRAEVDQRADA